MYCPPEAFLLFPCYGREKVTCFLLYFLSENFAGYGELHREFQFGSKYHDKGWLSTYRYSKKQCTGGILQNVPQVIYWCSGPANLQYSRAEGQCILCNRSYFPLLGIIFLKIAGKFFPQKQSGSVQSRFYSGNGQVQNFAHFFG